MSETVRVKPAPETKVRFEDPTLGHIPAEGADVPYSVYYHRRIADGDLVRVEKPARAAGGAGNKGGN